MRKRWVQSTDWKRLQINQQKSPKIVTCNDCHYLLIWSGAKWCKYCRSRQRSKPLNEYLEYWIQKSALIHPRTNCPSFLFGMPAYMRKEIGDDEEKSRKAIPSSALYPTTRETTMENVEEQIKNYLLSAPIPSTGRNLRDVPVQKQQLMLFLCSHYVDLYSSFPFFNVAILLWEWLQFCSTRSLVLDP